MQIKQFVYRCGTLGAIKTQYFLPLHMAAPYLVVMSSMQHKMSKKIKLPDKNFLMQSSQPILIQLLMT